MIYTAKNPTKPCYTLIGTVFVDPLASLNWICTSATIQDVLNKIELTPDTNGAFITAVALGSKKVITRMVRTIAGTIDDLEAAGYRRAPDTIQHPANPDRPNVDSFTVLTYNKEGPSEVLQTEGLPKLEPPYYKKTTNPAHGEGAWLVECYKGVPERAPFPTPLIT